MTGSYVREWENKTGKGRILDALMDSLILEAIITEFCYGLMQDGIKYISQLSQLRG